MKDKYRIKPGSRFSLKEFDADDAGKMDKDSAEAQAQLEKDLKRLANLQERLYAEAERSVLVVLQGMDTAGKDGTISHVMRGMNPAGCKIISFKQPTSEDLAHDFLWRVHQE